MRSVSPVIHFESSEAKNTAAVGCLVFTQELPHFSYGVVSSFSSVLTTNTASSFFLIRIALQEKQI